MPKLWHRVKRGSRFGEGSREQWGKGKIGMPAHHHHCNHHHYHCTGMLAQLACGLSAGRHGDALTCSNGIRASKLHHVTIGLASCRKLAETVSLTAKTFLTAVFTAAALHFEALAFSFALALGLLTSPASASMLAHSFAAAICDTHLIKTIALLDAVHA